MPYTPVDWVDGTTPVNAANLDHLEQGVVDAHAGLPPSISGQDGKWLKVTGGAMVWSDVGAEYQALSAKGIANGYASLDSGGKVPTAQLPSLGAPGYGTSLPGSPTDGQEYILVDSLTAPNYQWRFRYNAGSSHSDKWEFIGGAFLSAETAAADGTTSTSYIALANAGPAIAIPRAGVYEIGVGARISIAGTASAGFMSYDIGATGAVDADALFGSDVATSPQGPGHVFRTQRKTLTAVTLTAKYKVTGTPTVTFSNRVLRALPVRVS